MAPPSRRGTPPPTTSRPLLTALCRFIVGVAAILAAVGVGLAGAAGLARADRDALWRIVAQQCVPGEVQIRDPAPCADVEIESGEQRGYAVLKDTDGAHQYLLIPTARITGIEDPALREPMAPNYFAEAWRARSFTEARAGGSLPRDWVSLAVNSVETRSQDQLHIHIDCLRADVRQALDEQARGIGSAWTPMPLKLAGHRYEAMAVPNLDAVNPVALAAAQPLTADMGDTTLVVVGGGRDEASGFVLLRRRVEAGEVAGGEELQDHFNCPATLPDGPTTAK